MGQNPLRYIIEAGVPFKGSILSTLLPNGTVGYSGGQTIAEYELERGFTAQILTSDELDVLIAAHEDTLKCAPVKISKARYWEMLEILPPCRWTMAGMWEIFHISERLTGNLVSWFAHGRLRGQDFYFEFTDCDDLELDVLRVKLNEAFADA